MSEVEVSLKKPLTDVYLDDPYGPLPARWVRQPLWENRDADFITKAFHYIRARASGETATVLPRTHVVDHKAKSEAEVRERLEGAYRVQINELNGHVDRQRNAIAKLEDDVSRQKKTVDEQRQQIEKQRQEYVALQAKLEEERVIIEAALARLNESTQGLRNQHKQLVGEIQVAVRELAVMVASHVIHQKLTTEDETMVAIVRHVASRLESPEPIVVRLNPDDVALIRSRLTNDILPLEHGTVTIEEDPGLKRGDCMAVAGELAVTSRLQEQINDLRKTVMSV